MLPEQWQECLRRVIQLQSDLFFLASMTTLYLVQMSVDVIQRIPGLVSLQGSLTWAVVAAAVAVVPMHSDPHL